MAWFSNPTGKNGLLILCSVLCFVLVSAMVGGVAAKNCAAPKSLL